jgi:hypothetical protein
VSAGRTELLQVMREARALVALPDNNFDWSGWNDAEDALAEIDPLIAALEHGRLPGRLALRILFLPTGPLQEVSLSSGWGDEFVALADRFDAAEVQAFG